MRESNLSGNRLASGFCLQRLRLVYSQCQISDSNRKKDKNGQKNKNLYSTNTFITSVRYKKQSDDSYFLRI